MAACIGLPSVCGREKMQPSVDIDMLQPRDSAAGYAVCPGLFEQNGAQALGYGWNCCCFTGMTKSRMP